MVVSTLRWCLPRILRYALSALCCCALAGCVAPRVQTAGADVQEARLEHGVAVMADGARLPLREWRPAVLPRAAIVAVHGINDYSAGFERTGSFLAESGFAVYAFDQRGFGRAPGLGLWAGGGRMADDAWTVARLVRARHPGVPLYGVGESMGGAVLLHALQRHSPGFLDAVVLSAPAVWNRDEMPGYQRFALRVLAHTWRGLKLSGRSLGLRPSDDPATLRWLSEDPLVIKSTRMDTAWGLADLMDAATRDPVDPGVPMLVLYGARDEILPPKAMCTWLQALRGRDGWQVALYPSGWHLLTRDLDAARVLEDLAAWFEDPGSGLPSGADTERPIERVCALANARNGAG